MSPFLTRLVAVPALAGTILAGGAVAGVAPPALASSSQHSSHSAVSVAPALKIAAKYKGVPYRWGGTSTRGFDCSGYVQYVFGKLGVSLPRTAEAQWAATKHISRSQLKPGDLVFWGGPGWVYHVGIYAGHDRIWNAPHTGSRVRLETIWGGSKLYGRVRGVRTALPTDVTTLAQVTAVAAPLAGPATAPAATATPTATTPATTPATPPATTPAATPATATPATTPSATPATG